MYLIPALLIIKLTKYSMLNQEMLQLLWIITGGEIILFPMIKSVSGS